MSSKSANIPVVDVDQAFPALVGTTIGSTAVAPFDQGPTVRAAIRDVLGVRSREEDPKAFTDALTAAFRLVRIEGHIESQFVPRGYAIQADLGAVTGGQASLYRRASIARAEILRILDGLTPLRVDGDLEDMDAYRTIVRNAVVSLVDEMGAPGGPRIGMVDAYFTGLTGAGYGDTPDTIAGQLGALRDRFGLIDDNVNTVEEEGLRTAFWTLVDMVTDLNDAWDAQSGHFAGDDGAGFLGTELILISRLMEAASDQVDELEHILDSVLIPQSERQTIRLHEATNLTLDGLLTWLHVFLTDEGRRLAQDAGRDGIVSALAPTAVALAQTFQRFLVDPIVPCEPRHGQVPIRYLPAGCCTRWPAGMFAARVAIAVSSLCRLLMELARRAQKVGRYAGVVVIDVTVSEMHNFVDDGIQSHAANVEFRGMNMRPSYIPAFVKREARARGRDCCRAEELTVDDLILPMDLSATADGESISATFRYDAVTQVMGEAGVEVDLQGAVLPAADVPIAILNLETGSVVHAPWPTTWPRLTRADRPRGNVGKRGPDPEDDDPDWEVADYKLRNRSIDFDELGEPGDPPDNTAEVLLAAAAVKEAQDAANGLVAQAQIHHAGLQEMARIEKETYADAEARKIMLASQVAALEKERDRPGLGKDKKAQLATDLQRVRRQVRSAEKELDELAASVAHTTAEVDAAGLQVNALSAILERTRGAHDILDRTVKEH
jgi:hypothetical protein